MSEVSSPKSIDSGSSNSKFKTLKKKIRNKFRLSRPEEVKTLAQAVETLKRSDEFLTSSPQDSDQMKAEFKGTSNWIFIVFNYIFRIKGNSRKHYKPESNSFRGGQKCRFVMPGPF